MLSARAVRSIAYVALVLNELINTSIGLQLYSSSSFCGQKVHCGNVVSVHRPTAGMASLTMRKQKASDRRTRRLQRGGDDIAQDMINQSLQRTITSMPMTQWNYKSRGNVQQPSKEKSGGRGRSRKRSTLYHSLSSYHSKFLNLLTAEYKAEVRHWQPSGIILDAIMAARTLCFYRHWFEDSIPRILRYPPKFRVFFQCCTCTPMIQYYFPIRNNLTGR